ncbi:MAG: chemotaxis protein methyltransferase CheR [Oleiphilaceae bacterium]|jgi:chemotaxis protein methyltransferase CheR
MSIFQFEITDNEFKAFRTFIYDEAGINLSDEKKTLVTSRLSKRLRHYSLQSFQQYHDLMMAGNHSGEQQVAIDLLTTNETYFFREPKHFNFLEKQLLPKWPANKTLKVWSAASSSGEEAYSLAMLFDDMLGSNPWDIFASDINSQVLKTAQNGLYLQNRIDGIPKEFLRKYCLKGVDEHEGYLLINKSLRQKLIFSQVNLKRPLGNVGNFDIIFLRNVLIYFDMETKRKIIRQLVEKLQPKGYLFIGHSESLKDIHDGLKIVSPAIYQKL